MTHAPLDRRTSNVLQFIESTLHHLGSKTLGLLRADSGFYDQAVLQLLEGKHIDYIISARLTQGLQQAIIRNARWFALETGLELAEITYQAHGWNQARRIVLVRVRGIMGECRPSACAASSNKNRLMGYLG